MIDTKKRIINFDFLRGFFILLALYQHYGCYLNIWYKEYFNVKGFLGTNPTIHSSMIGTILTSDQISFYFATIFVPWVSQVYLTLAAFNLAKRSNTDFKRVFPTKIRIFSIIFFLFVLENFLVAPDLGEAVSFYPMHAWMVILILLSIFYRYFGIKGVISIFLISLVKWFPMGIDLSNNFELIVKNNFHEFFEYDARIDYFLTSGCLGFLMGYSYFQRPTFFLKDLKKIFLSGTIMLLVYFIFGPDFHFDLKDAFSSEHDLAKTLIGSVGIWGAQLTLLPFFLILEGKDIILNFKPIIYIGINSFFIFYLHRIFFVHLYMPMREILSVFLNQPLKNNTFEIWTSIAVFIGLAAYMNSFENLRSFFSHKVFYRL